MKWYLPTCSQFPIPIPSASATRSLSAVCVAFQSDGVLWRRRWDEGGRKLILDGSYRDSLLEILVSSRSFRFRSLPLYFLHLVIAFFIANKILLGYTLYTFPFRFLSHCIFVFSVQFPSNCFFPTAGTSISRFFCVWKQRLRKQV